MNRLAAETSPYLLQHADNPVDWHPWGEEAIERARRDDLPILLSIGYSACHWCHVMAHESFEDGATAALMNARFVNIKVDREERPDLDRVYQLGHQLLRRQGGGWPLTAFLDPQTLLPFFAGTYFPRQPRHGLPGFKDLLLRISDSFHDKRADLEAQGKKLASVLAELEQLAHESKSDHKALLKSAREQLGELYDSAAGGFGSAPKFPMPAALDWLLRHWGNIQETRSERPDRDALGMVTTTLTKMARGGIYDHLGGGFFRYSTDRQWSVPHFEKMLYDNGALLGLYADALALGPDPLFTDALRETAAWLMRDMQHPEGGYYAAVDADSEGEEGKYYVWRRNAVKRLLSEDEYLVAETLYGLDKPPNFEGRWNLKRQDAWRAVAERLYLSPEDAERNLASARAKLLAARAKRVPPAKDDKVLAAWNGIAIDGMAKAGMRLGEQAWIDSATRAVDFVRTHMVEDGRLHASWRQGAVGGRGYLDDHANMLCGLLSLLGARWRDADMRLAVFLAEELLARFEDRDAGGFFFTAHDHEELIHRPKPHVDDALPPGNATAARALLALGHLRGEVRFLEAGQRALAWARGFAERQPVGHCALLTALAMDALPQQQVIVRGPREALGEWLEAARRGYHPNRVVYGIPYDAADIPPYLPRLVSADTQARVCAFFCSGMECSAPTTSLDEFRRALSPSTVARI